MTNPHLVNHIRAALNGGVVKFTEEAGGLKLRQYQVDVAKAVIESVWKKKGLTFVVMFPRQSGKNELQAQLESFLMCLYHDLGGEIVKVSPTWKPQSENAMARLERVLKRNNITRVLWDKHNGYIYQIGGCTVKFMSGGTEANIVGATASLLLQVDEAQDVQIAKFDKEVSPMAASTNATRVFWGTAWTSKTLLARELRAAEEAERRDHERRVFRLTAEDVGVEVPAYKAYVDEQVAKLGRTNPMVRTQYFSEEIDAEGGMFPAWRVALMEGSHPAAERPAAGKVYAALLDVAGEDEGITDIGQDSLTNPRRDSTALTIVEVDLSTVSDSIIKAPTYRVMTRREWVGVKHSKLYGEIKALADLWRVRWLVIDATGVGAGLASFLDKALPGRVLPFVFSQKSKSELGWAFLGVIDSGRWKEGRGEFTAETQRPRRNAETEIREKFFKQLEYCEYEVLAGPGKVMRWGVQDGRRDVSTGELVHDDLILSSALVGVLEEQEWSTSGPALVVRPAVDPLSELDKGF